MNDKTIPVHLVLSVKLIEQIKIISQRKKISDEDLMNFYLSEKVKEEFASN